MLAFAAAIAASNMFLARRALAPGNASRVSNSDLVAWAFVLDIGCLTGLLAMSGGPSNPFSLLYLVHITLAATILTKRWTWFLGFLATACFGLLFIAHRPVPAFGVHHHGDGPSLHLLGMWAAFAVAAFLVALFSGKISELIRSHEESLRSMQIELARKDRLASLVTLAAGAAHELGSPLGTIAVVAKDVETYAARQIDDRVVAEDCRLIRAEVDRCQAILANMSVQGAEPVGEAPGWTVPEVLLGDMEREFACGGRLQIEIDASAAGAQLFLPPRAMRQAVQALVKNALEAAAPAGMVRVLARRENDRLLIEVIDQGHGMTEDQLRRVGEPFF
ncbi:MAG: HAMP domain-containing sensor histidine kinase, partial [Desulfobacterales bacterium]|nr:HAMP domain-containing sensor histidine kinase [Desulfobacterales bacterium]